MTIHECSTSIAGGGAAKMEMRALIRRLVAVSLILLFYALTFAFNLGDALKSIQQSAGNAVNKAKESVSDIYEKAKDTVSDTYNKAKDTAGNLYDSAKDTVGNVIKDTTNKVGNHSQQLSNTIKEQGKEALRTIEKKASEIVNMDTRELVNKASEIKDWTVNEGEKVWKEMDEYPLLKSVVQIAADQAYESTVGEVKTEIMLATAVYEIAKDGRLDSEEMMDFCDRVVTMAIEEELAEVEMAVQIVGVVSEASGLMSESEVNQMLGLYYKAVDIAFYNRDWDEKEIIELMYYISESLPMYDYSIEEITPVVEKAIAQAKNRSIEPEQVIRELRMELGYAGEPIDYLTHSALIIAGILLSFFGYRILRSSAWLIGILLLPTLLGISVYFLSGNVTITVVVVVVALLASIFIRKMFFYLLVGLVGFAITYVLIVFMISRGVIESIPVEWLFGISAIGGMVILLIRKFTAITITSLTGAYIIVSSTTSIINMISPGIFAGSGPVSIQRIGTNMRAFVLSLQTIARYLFDQIASFLYLDRLNIDLMPIKPSYANLSGGSQYFYFSLIVVILVVFFVVFQYRKQKPKTAKRTVESRERSELADRQDGFIT